MVATRDPRALPGVDQVLVPPVVDRLVTDPEIGGDLGDRAARLQQVKDLATKLRWVSPGHVSPSDADTKSKINQLHQLRGTSPMSLVLTTGCALAVGAFDALPPRWWWLVLVPLALQFAGIWIWEVGLESAAGGLNGSKDTAVTALAILAGIAVISLAVIAGLQRDSGSPDGQSGKALSQGA